MSPFLIIDHAPHDCTAEVGTTATFKVRVTSMWPPTYQWYRDSIAIPGATSASYTTPPVERGDDGCKFRVVVKAGGRKVSPLPAKLTVLPARPTLASWLQAHPAIAAAIKWQTRPADPANAYAPPAETDKVAWADWSPSQQAELSAAYDETRSWLAQGAPQVTMTPGGPGLTDEPVNLRTDKDQDTTDTWQEVTADYMWQLYLAHVAFALALETTARLPWSIAGYPDSALRYLLDSTTMAWKFFGPDFYLGMNSSRLPALRRDNLPHTAFADPKWTFPFLAKAGIVEATRQATIGKLLDWMRANMTHIRGRDTYGNAQAIWQYRGYPPLSKIVAGTVDANNPTLGAQHWTAGCSGSVGFLAATLRVLNIPVQPVWVYLHELAYFVVDDLYLDHGDDPYDATVRASSQPSLALLIDGATYRTRFTTDPAVNLLGYPRAVDYVGWQAAHFPP